MEEKGANTKWRLEEHISQAKTPHAYEYKTIEKSLWKILKLFINMFIKFCKFCINKNKHIYKLFQDLY